MKLLSGTAAGESIYWCKNDEVVESIVARAIDKWYSQGQNYSFETGRSKNATAIGNFTQMVWNNSRKMGIAVATSSSHTFVVARYLPAGNVSGQYSANVLKTVKELNTKCTLLSTTNVLKCTDVNNRVQMISDNRSSTEVARRT